ncbi:putative transcription factor C2C2-CO-like family [Helianthus debilis subsp. tardiflorus]
MMAIFGLKKLHVCLLDLLLWKQKLVLNRKYALENKEELIIKLKGVLREKFDVFNSDEQEEDKALTEFPARLSQPQRAALLSRFKEKRKERCFDKKICYSVCKEVALRIQSKKGQFTSSKAVSNEDGSATSDWNGGPGQDEETMMCN